MTPRQHITGKPCPECNGTQYFAVTGKCVRCNYRRNGQRLAEAAIVKNAGRIVVNQPKTPESEMERLMGGTRFEDV